ncbi:hypothetical protein BJV74DRAFT_800426 [Russula compacta]|nr:hypothetical protein BJV74DRAFT_800426 [Russula compacta]
MLRRLICSGLRKSECGSNSHTARPRYASCTFWEPGPLSGTSRGPCGDQAICPGVFSTRKLGPVATRTCQHCAGLAAEPLWPWERVARRLDDVS